MPKFLPRFDNALIEEIAIQIYMYQGNSPHLDEDIHGKKRRVWMTDAPWDTNPDELCEWERDEYRTQARAVVDHFVNDPELLACLNAQARKR